MSHTPLPALNHTHVSTLDGLRGISVLIIMVFHTHPLWISGGFIGVDVFFVLSGFLITTLLLQERKQYGRIFFLSFYLRRLLRLAPALLLMLSILVPAYWLFTPAERALSYSKEAAFALTYTSNWAVALDLYPMSHLRHTWSLAIEEQFYLIWPLLLTLICRTVQQKYRIGVCVLIWLTLVLLRVWLAEQGAAIDRLYCGLDTRADALILGAITAFWYTGQLHQNKTLARRLSAVFFLPATLTLGWFLYNTNYLYRELYYWQMPVIQLCAAVVILHLTCARAGAARAFFQIPPLLYLGKISYGVYLWHVPVLLLVIDYKLPGHFMLICVVTGAMAAASASYYLVERPVLRLKKHLSAKHASPAATQVQARAGRGI